MFRKRIFPAFRSGARLAVDEIDKNSSPFVEEKIASFKTGTGFEEFTDSITVEEPLEIRLCTPDFSKCRPVSVTMRTPGRDIDLAAGFLLTEGIVAEKDDFLSIQHGRNSNNTVEASVSDDLYRKSADYRRDFAANSSCGICGKSSINEVFVKGSRILRDSARIDATTLLKLPDEMRKQQEVFAKTGGIHAAAIFDTHGNLLSFAEDIGRHNSVDKVIGDLFMREMLPSPDSVLQVSGRAGFEIVQKAIVAGIPIISSVSAPTSLSVQTAQSFNATLVCFSRGTRLNVYGSRERIVPE